GEGGRNRPTESTARQAAGGASVTSKVRRSPNTLHRVRQRRSAGVGGGWPDVRPLYWCLFTDFHEDLMAHTEAIVLGAGIVGTSIALHLAKRGVSVALVDRRGPGEETSYGNAGVIEGNTLLPHPFPVPGRAHGADAGCAQTCDRGELSCRLSAVDRALAPRIPRQFHARAPDRIRRGDAPLVRAGAARACGADGRERRRALSAQERLA